MIDKYLPAGTAVWWNAWDGVSTGELLGVGEHGDVAVKLDGKVVMTRVEATFASAVEAWERRAAVEMLAAKSSIESATEALARAADCRTCQASDGQPRAA